MRVLEGGSISTQTARSGQGGKLEIQAESVEVDGSDFANGDIQQSQIEAGTMGAGNAQNLSIRGAKRVAVTNGGRISSGTSTPDAESGEARGGEIIIESQVVEVSGTTPDPLPALSSSINAEPSGLGEGGSVEITADNIRVNNGGEITTNASGAGNAGEIRLTVTGDKTLLVSGEQRGRASCISAGTTGDGRAGNILVDATGNVILEDNAEISVSSTGSGDPGNIELSAQNLTLNDSRISAVSSSGRDANIQLAIADLLLMENGSAITAEAQNNGDGGNIDIRADFIIGVPANANQIQANAFEGGGGNISISTRGIIGITPTASSELGVDGKVEISSPEVDPSQAVVRLADDPISTEVMQACSPGGQTVAQSEFVYTGRSGLPPSPTEIVTQGGPTVGWATGSEATTQTAVKEYEAMPEGTPSLVEAKTWRHTADGQIQLVAVAPVATSSVDCMIQADADGEESYEAD
ncbi:MAG: S-layer family protein [Cyanobacteria bacterium P01_H01_bin.15]